MASIPMHVLKAAADLYRQPGNTWADVVRKLGAQGRRHSRKHLQRKCKQLGLLAQPGACICALCKSEFTPDPNQVRKPRYCPRCRKNELPRLISIRRQRQRSTGRASACSQ